MPNWIIRCKGDGRYTVILAECSPEHAAVALESLKRNPYTPDGLYLERTDGAKPKRRLRIRKRNG